MKILDYGKMAATFLNLETRQAVRISSLNRPATAPPGEDPEAALQVLKAMANEDLFRVQEVRVPLGPGDMPGRPVRSVPCAMCGEAVLDQRDVAVRGETWCRPCAEHHRYYEPLAPASLR